MTSKVQFKRSPLKEKSLRLPGQSLDEAINDLIDDKVLVYVMAATSFVTLAMFEWTRWLWPLPKQPWISTAAAVLVVGVSYFKLRRYKAQLENLKLGRDGEREVGTSLEELRAQGCLVFHDVQGEGFNLDHVVVSPQGVFLIETKTRRKPPGDHRVSFDGRRVLVDGQRPERDPVEQAERGARWLRGLLRESTGKRFPVRPVVVYPGWYVESKKRPQEQGAWVLNPKQLPAYLSRSPNVLEETDLHLAAFHLARYMRAAK